MFRKVGIGPQASQWWFGVLVTAAIGLVAVLVAGELGDHAVRWLLLAVMMGLFVAGGTLLGLLLAYHVCQTHLPETQDDFAAQRRGQSTTATADHCEKRERGFLGLFGADSASPLSGNSPSSARTVERPSPTSEASSFS